MPYLAVEEFSLLFIGIKTKEVNIEHCRISLKLICLIY
jgi:hypothetical protein